MAQALAVCLAGAIVLCGCATKRFPAPPSEEVRANMGMIGIMAGTLRTNASVQKPMTRRAGAAVGAAEGALWGLQAGAQVARGGGDFGALAAIAVWAVTVPVGTVVGAAIGADEGMSAKQRRETEEQLRRAILSMNLQEEMTQKIILEAEKQTGHRIVLAAEARAPGDQAGNSSITNADTFLEVTVWNVGLCGPSSSKEPMAAFMQVQVRLVRTRDDAELYKHTWLHKAGARRFSEWADRQACALREECDRISSRMTESIVEELFLIYDPQQSSRNSK